MLAGPGVSRTLELESAANRGEVRVDATTARVLDPHDVDEQSDGSFLLRRPPAVAVVEPAPREGASAAAGVPEIVRGHLDGTRKDGEHRIAAVGFLKFGGTDRLLDAEGPAAVEAALDALLLAVQEQCRAHEVTFVGTDVDGDGGKVILATGMPSAADDDEDRLLLAVQAVVGEAASLRLDVRAGLHRGRIFAVDLGSPNRRTFTVMGDAVNLAARVMGHASVEHGGRHRRRPPAASHRLRARAAPTVRRQGQVGGDPRSGRGPAPRSA